MGYIYRVFIKGLLTLLPITVTIYLLVWLMTRAENALGEPLQSWLPFYFPGVGVVLALVLIFLAGLFVDSYLTQKIFAWFESRFENLPVIRSIYGPIRDVTNLFGRTENSGQKVVMVRLPDSGIELLGLVTRDQFHDLPAGTVPTETVAVFVPFSYGMGGFTVIVPRSSLRKRSFLRIEPCNSRSPVGSSLRVNLCNFVLFKE